MMISASRRTDIPAFIRMSGQNGSLRSVWRYGPVVVDGNHTVGWHIEQFSEMCEALRGHTERCVLSFADPYKGLTDRHRVPAGDGIITNRTTPSQIIAQLILF